MIFYLNKELDTLENESDREGVRIRLLENINIEKEATVKVSSRASTQNLNFKMGKKEKIEFIFTNTSSDFPATGVNDYNHKKSRRKSRDGKKKLNLYNLEPNKKHIVSLDIEIEQSDIIKNLSYEAQFKYCEGTPVTPKLRLIIGFLPKPGNVLLAITKQGRLGIIETLNQKPEVLNKGLHLRFSDWTSITWSPTLKKYLVVGNPMYIGQSQNGILWKYQHNPTQKPLMKIRWNSTLAHYIAAGKKGAITISYYGINWNAYEIDGKPNLNHVLWCVKKNITFSLEKKVI